jgi:hypothetical protein
MVNKDKKMMLHQRPFSAEAQIKQVEEIDHVNQGEDHVVFNPIPFESFADHDTKVGKQSRRKEQQEMNIEQCIIGFFIFSQFLIAKQQQIGKYKE